MINVDRYGNTSSGSIPLALRGCGGGRQASARQARIDDGNGSRTDLGERSYPLDEGGCVMAAATKIAFCFPGQGSFEAGMGRDIAEAVPAAMRRVRERKRGVGLDLERLCFDGTRRGAVRDRRAAAGARRDLASPCSRPLRDARRRAGLRRRPLGRRVRGARGRAGDERRRGDRARARARARDGRGGARAARLDGGDPRPRRRGGRDALPEDPRRLAGELQLPGADRRLRREPRRRRVLRAGHRGRCAARGQAQGLGRVPLAARRPRRRPAAPGDREGQLHRARGAVHVDGDRARRGGAADGAAARRPADRARALHAGGDAS